MWYRQTDINMPSVYKAGMWPSPAHAWSTCRLSTATLKSYKLKSHFLPSNTQRAWGNPSLRQETSALERHTTTPKTLRFRSHVQNAGGTITSWVEWEGFGWFRPKRECQRFPEVPPRPNVKPRGQRWKFWKVQLKLTLNTDHTEGQNSWRQKISLRLSPNTHHVVSEDFGKPFILKTLQEQKDQLGF